MNGNEALINRFYTAFQQLDYKTMQDCYQDDAVFSDPVFGLLQGREVKAMWEMLCKNAKTFRSRIPIFSCWTKNMLPAIGRPLILFQKLAGKW